METKLLEFAAFYKNNLPGGVGINIKEGKNPEIFKKEVDNIIRLWMDAYNKEDDKAGLLDTYEEQLRSYGANLRTQRGSEEVANFWPVMLGNIHVLVVSGRIPSDEYNGVIYHYQP